MSTCVASIDYDEKTRTLVVGFVKGGGSYTYEDVPPLVVKNFKSAGSLGQFFNSNIKNSY